MAKKQYGLGHTRLTVPGRPDLTNKTAVVMVGDKTLEEALEEGGTSDYEDLDNLPSINGVELSGNKTSSDLGVATSQQGAKADTAYQKPNTGIPETDLSSDVQQALQKHFKGWYNTLEELKAAHTATDGDSAYVKDASPATTWSIYVYDATATTDNNWADSGTDADTSNVQTFASSQEVNQTYIDNTNLINPISGSLVKSEDALQLVSKLRGVNVEEYAAPETPILNSLVRGTTGAIESSNGNAYIEVNLGSYEKVRFLGAIYITGYTSGYAFGHYTDPSDPTTWVTDRSAVYDIGESLGLKEYIEEKPTDSTHFRATCGNNTSLPTWLSSFYCYLIKGDNVADIISKQNASYIGRKGNYIDGYKLNDTNNLIQDTDCCVSDYILLEDRYSGGGYTNNISVIIFSPNFDVDNNPFFIQFYYGDTPNERIAYSNQYFIVNAAPKQVGVGDYNGQVSNHPYWYVRFSFFKSQKDKVYASKLDNTVIYRAIDEVNSIIVSETKKELLIKEEKLTLKAGQIYTNEGVGNVCAKLTYVTDNTLYYLGAVSEGDTFRLFNCIGGVSPRQYCFLDSNDVILEVAPASCNQNPNIIVAPHGATQVIINTLNLIGEVVKIGNFSSLSEFVDDSINSKENFVDIPCNFYSDSYIQVNGTITVSTLGNTRYGYVDISKFKKLKYSRSCTTGSSSGDTAAIILLDANYNVLFAEKYNINASEEHLEDSEVILPNNAKYCAGTCFSSLINGFFLSGVTREETEAFLNEKIISKPKYYDWRSRFSLMKDFGEQPAANGSAGSFSNALNGTYNDLLTTVYEPLRAAFPNYITRTNIGKDASGEIDMYAYDFQPKYYQQHIYLQAGIHAVEPEAVGALARIMYLISHAMEGNDEDFKFMRQNIRFTIVPCVNVWGFSQSPKVNTNSEGENMQVWDGDNVPQEMQNIKNYIFNNDLLKEFSFMLDMHTTTNNTYSNFYGALQRHAKNSRTIFRVNSWLYDNFIPARGVVHNEGKDLGYRETAPNIFRMYWYKQGVETFTPEFTDDIWDGNNRCTSETQSVAVSMYLNYLIQMMNDFYVSMYDVPNSDYHQTAG